MSDYGGSNYRFHFLAGFDIPTSQNKCITVLVVLVTTCSYPLPVEIFGLCTWQQSTDCILGIWKCYWSPSIILMAKILASVVNTNNYHCTVKNLVVGNDLPHYLPDMTQCACLTECSGQDLLWFFDAQLLGTGEHLSSGPLGWSCFCTVLVAVPGHRPCEVPLGTISCWDPNLLGAQVNH